MPENPTPVPLLDPWDDAERLARYLADPQHRVTIGLGAEWCGLCQTFKPLFQARAAETGNPREHWLWLNLEEHAELLGDFFPETLPLVWVYQGGLLRYAQVLLTPTEDSAELEITLHSLEIAPPVDVGARLSRADWAS
ncbi:thioredoxin family protein [Pseudomonas sp. RIT-PI-AD]|uniref:thioredoxin family protein n=1 Tax=Pseudomonas sp. RIT-PI-AD TaxID=3035294 RepID=UPI0021D95D99|nr:thioredoxin family protein [Pseudomonas sp. RIT-PI-AD]